MLAREDLLWCRAVKVSQQAVSQRFLSFPAKLFERLFMELLPQLQQRSSQRIQRPLAASVELARKRFERIWIADTSTLEALFRHLDSLQDKPAGTKRWEDGNGGRFSQPPASADLVQRESEHQ